MSDLIVPQRIVTMSIADLRPHPASPRIGDVDAIVNSMRVNGNYNVIVVQESTGLILAGGHRWRALLDQGIDTARVALVDVDDDTATQIVFTDNRTHDLGEYNNETLADILTDLDDYDGTGYDDQAVAAILRDVGRGPVVEERASVDRTVVIRMPCDQYEQVVDALPNLCDEWAVDSDAAAVLGLLRDRARTAGLA